MNFHIRLETRTQPPHIFRRGPRRCINFHFVTQFVHKPAPAARKRQTIKYKQWNWLRNGQCTPPVRQILGRSMPENKSINRNTNRPVNTRRSTLCGLSSFLLFQLNERSCIVWFEQWFGNSHVHRWTSIAAASPSSALFCRSFLFSFYLFRPLCNIYTLHASWRTEELLQKFYHRNENRLFSW